jgi:hypothetical protein
MDPTLSQRRVDQLTRSLIADAHHHGGGGEEGLAQVSAVYQALLEKAQRVPGYPYLYRQAWLLLLRALQGEQWHTLHDIDTVFQLVFPDNNSSDIEAALRQELISPWHLKAVLYAWSRLPDAVDVDDTHPATLNNRERAAELLGQVSACHAFINLAPQEAALKLVRASLDNGRGAPYLFRLSTTEPGVISLSFLGPVSGQVVHHRLRSGALLELYARTANLYATLVDEATTRDHIDAVDGTALLIMMRKIDPHAKSQLLSLAMRQRYGRGDDAPVVHHRDVYRELRRVFFPSGGEITTRQLVPLLSDMATDSYRDSYVSLSSPASYVVASCFNDACGSTELTHKDELSHRLYCQRPECYQLDYVVKCY